jgi:hypothetical protein
MNSREYKQSEAHAVAEVAHASAFQEEVAS